MNETIVNPSLPKKRGRKKKVIPANIPNSETVNITITLEENDSTLQPTNETNLPKKRGRKPKGGKLVTKTQETNNSNNTIANIVLHLKCSMQDLTDHNTVIKQMVTDPMSYNPNIPPSILTYNNDNSVFTPYENINSTEKLIERKDFAYAEFEEKKLSNIQNICHSCSMKISDELPCQSTDEEDDINIKDVNAKLKKLKIQLYKNSNPDKKSACFWCTYEYDNPSCYIPKYENDDQVFGYGSFCRPECAVAYLMKENLDDSTKFERYHLLNQIYSKVYDYKKNIKPAPNPYFLLDKYYGNLTIQEYRKLLKTEHMLLVIDKPLTRILPELHEDNEDFIMNIYGGTSQPNQNVSGVYKVKRESEKQKGPSKKSIMKDKFGLSS
jgi:hypothetical protein